MAKGHGRDLSLARPGESQYFAPCIEYAFFTVLRDSAYVLDSSQAMPSKSRDERGNVSRGALS